MATADPRHCKRWRAPRLACRGFWEPDQRRTGHLGPVPASGVPHPAGVWGVGAQRPRAGRSSRTCRPRAQECTLKVQDGKFKLQDLLVVPMQRVLKYHLLLKVSALSGPRAGGALVLSTSNRLQFRGTGFLGSVRPEGCLRSGLFDTKS